MPSNTTTGETMHTQLLAYLDTIPLDTFESAIMPITKTHNLSIKLVSRDMQLPPATGIWTDFLARNILQCLSIAQREDLDAMPLTTCFVHKNVGYRFDIEINKAAPKALPSTPTEPTTLSTPTGPRQVRDLPYPPPNRVPNISGVSGNQNRGNNR